MTCVVGFVENGIVYLGADSQGTGGNSKVTRLDKKVFHRGPFVLGFTSSFRMGQLLQYSLHVPEHPKGMDDHQFMSTIFIDAVRKCLSDGGFARTDSGVESAGNFLAGYNGVLYQVESDFQVGISAEPYDAVGCGSDLALGAMHATLDCDGEPYARLEAALEASAKFSSGVGPPFNYIKSEPLAKEVEGTSD